MPISALHTLIQYHYKSLVGTYYNLLIHEITNNTEKPEIEMCPLTKFECSQQVA